LNAVVIFRYERPVERTQRVRGRGRETDGPSRFAICTFRTPHHHLFAGVDGHVSHVSHVSACFRIEVHGSRRLSTAIPRPHWRSIRCELVRLRNRGSSPLILQRWVQKRVPSSSFPSSAWERALAKLRFAGEIDARRRGRAWFREAELRRCAFPSRAWERGFGLPALKPSAVELSDRHGSGLATVRESRTAPTARGRFTLMPLGVMKNDRPRPTDERQGHRRGVAEFPHGAAQLFQGRGGGAPEGSIPGDTAFLSQPVDG